MTGRRALFDEAAARHDYETGTDGLDVLAERYGISRTTLYSRAKEGGWRRAQAAVQRPRRSKAALLAIRREECRRLFGANIVGKLYAAIERKMEEIEKRMTDQAEGCAPQSAADTERDIRAMNQLMQLYAKVKELDEQASREGSDPDAAKGMSDDADRFRRDLALRLERLNRGGDA